MTSLQEFPCKPSEVRKNGGRPLPIPVCQVPLTDTLGKFEKEVVAAMVVEYCREQGDEWVPMSTPEVARYYEAYVESNGFLATLNVINTIVGMGDEGLLLINRDVTPNTITATPQLVELIK